MLLRNTKSQGQQQFAWKEEVGNTNSGHRSQSTIAQAVTSNPVALHILGTRKVAQLQHAHIQM